MKRLFFLFMLINIFLLLNTTVSFSLYRYDYDVLKKKLEYFDNSVDADMVQKFKIVLINESKMTDREVKNTACKIGQEIKELKGMHTILIDVLKEDQSSKRMHLVIDGDRCSRH